MCDPGEEQPVSANISLSPGDGRLELLLFHPTAAGLLAVGSGRGVQVWDTSRDKALAGTLPLPPTPHTHLHTHTFGLSQSQASIISLHVSINKNSQVYSST